MEPRARNSQNPVPVLRLELPEMGTRGTASPLQRNASGQALSASILQPQALSAIDPQAIEAIEAGIT